MPHAIDQQVHEDGENFFCPTNLHCSTHVSTLRTGPADQAIELVSQSSLSVWCVSKFALYRCMLTALRLRRYACMFCWAWTMKAWRGLVCMQLGNARPSSMECTSTYGHIYGPLSLLHLVADSTIGM